MKHRETERETRVRKREKEGETTEISEQADGYRAKPVTFSGLLFLLLVQSPVSYQGYKK